MITGAASRPWPGDVPVSDLAAAGLPAPSVVRPARIATIAAAHAEPLGRLLPADQVPIAAALRRILAAIPADPPLTSAAARPPSPAGSPPRSTGSG